MHIILKITMPRGGHHEGMKISCYSLRRFYFRSNSWKWLEGSLSAAVSTFVILIWTIYIIQSIHINSIWNENIINMYFRHEASQI